MVFFFQAEDGIRDLVRSRGLGDVYKRQELSFSGVLVNPIIFLGSISNTSFGIGISGTNGTFCLLYTSDAADDLLCVDLGGRRIIKTKKNKNTT